MPSFTEIAQFRRELGTLKTVRIQHDLIGRAGPIAPLLDNHARRIRNGGPLRVLDIGAHDRALERALSRCGLNGTYHSIDVDCACPHDFRDIREVTGPYDLICMSELIEHLDLQEVDDLCHRAKDLLAPGGKLYISTPNPFHPTRFFADMTHKQHWPPADLFALLRHVGFSTNQIDMYGVIFSERFSLANALHVWVNWTRGAIWRVIGLERRGGLVAIATNTSVACAPAGTGMTA